MFRPGDKIGPYTLLNKLGRGAFGVVWLAERRTAITTTRVAIKMPLDDDVSLDAIRQEADLWVEVSGHPNVVPIIEANIYDDQIIIASEYAPDGSLDTWLNKNGGVASSIETASEMLSGILAGLEHLHSKHIIHRDLKPANILLQGKIPRLADFGISRILKSTSQSSIVAGTPYYMAAEAFDGKRNEQTDIWSVGVIFYQMLSGRLPFPHSDITSLVGAILNKNPDPLPDSVPTPLREVVAQSLEKDRSKRYKSAVAMRDSLRRAREQDMAITIPHNRHINILNMLEATVSNPHYRHDFKQLEGVWNLTKVLNTQTIMVVTGSHLVSELLDRPVAEIIRDEIDRQGDVSLCKRAVIVGDLWLLQETKDQSHPVISVGGPSINRVTSEIASMGERWKYSQGVYGGMINGPFPGIALWGESSAQTRASVEFFIQDAKGLNRFLEMCWHSK